MNNEEPLWVKLTQPLIPPKSNFIGMVSMVKELQKQQLCEHIRSGNKPSICQKCRALNPEVLNNLTSGWKHDE